MLPSSLLQLIQQPLCCLLSALYFIVNPVKKSEETIYNYAWSLTESVVTKCSVFWDKMWFLISFTTFWITLLPLIHIVHPDIYKSNYIGRIIIADWCANNWFSLTWLLLLIQLCVCGDLFFLLLKCPAVWKVWVRVGLLVWFLLVGIIFLIILCSTWNNQILIIGNYFCEMVVNIFIWQLCLEIFTWRDRIRLYFFSLSII